MGLFDLFKSIFSTPKAPKQNGKLKSPLPSGSRLLETGECPYCSYQFEKPPSRKKKCPECNQFVYVRTLPNTTTRVLVTEKTAEMIDLEWAKINGTYNDLMRERAHKEKVRDSLRKAWKQEPSDSDVEWHYLMEKRIECAQNGQWGLYRNYTLYMGEHLRKLGKHRRALELYLEVLYYDANGPINVARINGVPQVYEKGFDPETRPFFPSSVVDHARRAAQRSGVTFEKVKEIFLKWNEVIYHGQQLPVSPEEAWEKIEKHLEESFRKKSKKRMMTQGGGIDG